MHRRGGVSSALPDEPLFPRLLDSYDDGDWVALAFRAVEGRLPRHPWDPAELRTVMDGVATMHERLTPSPCDTAPVTTYFQPMFDGWQTLAAGHDSVGALDEWSRRHLDRLAQLEARWSEASRGRTLIHGDIRSDNMLLSTRGVVFVDWPHAAVGSPILDLVAWAPSVALE